MTSGISSGRRGILSTSARRPKLMFCSAELDLPATLRHQTVAHSAAVLETSCRSAGFTGKKEAFHHKAALEGANYGQGEGKRAFIKSGNISSVFFLSRFPNGAVCLGGNASFLIGLAVGVGKAGQTAAAWEPPPERRVQEKPRRVWVTT